MPTGERQSPLAFRLFLFFAVLVQSILPEPKGLLQRMILLAKGQAVKLAIPSSNHNMLFGSLSNQNLDRCC